jgi:prephenate dehydrogenase
MLPPMNHPRQCQFAATQITLIGTGLLGASVGLGLKAAGCTGRIVGVGRRRASVERALQCGAVDAVSEDLAASLADSSLALIAVPLSGFAAVFEQIRPAEHEGLTITDVGSAKQCVADHARKHLAAPQRFVGSHPMAGSEQQGPDAAQADLFAGKPCIICPEPDSDPHAVSQVKKLWQSLDMHLMEMSSAEHDRQTALTSHLPHAAAAMLMQVADQHGGWDVASTGFRDTTRLASSNPPMRSDIMFANREHLVEAISSYRQQLEALSDILQRNDEEALRQLLTKSKTVRDNWISRPKESP